MKLGALKNHFESELSDTYPKEEIQSFFTLLLDYFLNYSRIDSVTRASETIANDEVEKFNETIIRLQRHEPIQYIIGETEFFGFPFFVNEHTLVPRPETEELVLWVLSEMKGRESQRILDIGTGSGCIAVSIAKNEPQSEVMALDISAKALEVARKNAERNDVAVTYHLHDILSEPLTYGNFDIIVSNPPYVRELEKAQMNPNVLEYEPDAALFVPDGDPLVFYRAIARQAKDCLNLGGFLFFEINEYLGKEMSSLLSSLGYRDIVVQKDMFGKDRMIKCTHHGSTE